MTISYVITCDIGIYSTHKYMYLDKLHTTRHYTQDITHNKTLHTTRHYTQQDITHNILAFFYLDTYIYVLNKYLYHKLLHMKWS
jgi:hypothetical protein